MTLSRRATRVPDEVPGDAAHRNPPQCEKYSGSRPHVIYASLPFFVHPGPSQSLESLVGRWHPGTVAADGYSWASSARARRVMLGNRSRDTKPELAVRRQLHAMGLRYRVAYRPVPSVRRTADVVFTRWRVAVFIDGCYWHACPRHGTVSKSNTEYWTKKLERNVARDADTTVKLTEAGWVVLRFWEHEDPKEVVEVIRQALLVAGAFPS